MATYVLMAGYVFTYIAAFIASFWLIAIDTRRESAFSRPEDVPGATDRAQTQTAGWRSRLPSAGKDRRRTGDDAPVSATSTREARTMFQAPALYVLGAIAFALAFMVLFAVLRQ